MDVDLVRLRYFAAVAEVLHFGRAATALNLPRAVLSSAITDLEAELGVELFVRPSEHTALTDAGRTLLDQARGMLADADVAVPAVTGVGPTPSFTVAIVPGVTVSKWTRLWAERKPDVPVRVLRTDPEHQVTVLRARTADVSFVRLPVERAGLSLIPLYSELPVVVIPKDHELTLLDSVRVVDLIEEHLLQDPDTVPEWRDAANALRVGERRPLPAMASVAEAIALVAAGLGIVIVPQSVARTNHRKDVTYRRVLDAAEYPVALAWLADRTTDQVEEFVGIVRGRSATSSRSPASPDRTPTVPAPRTGGRPGPARDSKSSAGMARTGSKPARKARRPRGTR